jgi:hypothetical protein
MIKKMTGAGDDSTSDPRTKVVHQGHHRMVGCRKPWLVLVDALPCGGGQTNNDLGEEWEAKLDHGGSPQQGSLELSPRSRHESLFVGVGGWNFNNETDSLAEYSGIRRIERTPKRV